MIIAALALWAAFNAPRMTKLLRPLAAMAMAPPLTSMARSINFPLTKRALEFGKHLTTFGGRPICKAFSKSAVLLLLVAAMAYPPYYLVINRVDGIRFLWIVSKNYTG
jgi:hypothetical protein